MLEAFFFIYKATWLKRSNDSPQTNPVINKSVRNTYSSILFIHTLNCLKSVKLSFLFLQYTASLRNNFSFFPPDLFQHTEIYILYILKVWFHHTYKIKVAYTETSLFHLRTVFIKTNFRKYPQSFGYSTEWPIFIFPFFFFFSQGHLLFSVHEDFFKNYTAAELLEITPILHHKLYHIIFLRSREKLIRWQYSDKSPHIKNESSISCWSVCSREDKWGILK